MYSNSNFLPHNSLLHFFIRSSSNSSSNLERGRSSTNSSGVPQQNGIGGASIESSKGRGFTNILTFKSNNDNEAGRSRIPSSRNYPSSPILPINSATNEEHNNPLTKICWPYEIMATFRLSGELTRSGINSILFCLLFTTIRRPFEVNKKWLKTSRLALVDYTVSGDLRA